MSQRAAKVPLKAKPDEIWELPAEAWDFDTSWDFEIDLPVLFESYAVTVEQKEIIDRAIQKCRNLCDFPNMYEGRALELIAAEFLS